MVQPGAKERFLSNRRADQQRALQHLQEDAGLRELQVVTGPLFDLEVSWPRGTGLWALQVVTGPLFDLEVSVLGGRGCGSYML